MSYAERYSFGIENRTDFWAEQAACTEQPTQRLSTEQRNHQTCHSVIAKRILKVCLGRFSEKSCVGLAMANLFAYRPPLMALQL